MLAGPAAAPFDRLRAEAAGEEGTSRGRALSQRLSEGMGGRIGVKSADGAGSTFGIELPLVDAPAPVAPTAAEAAPATVVGPMRTVLLVDRNLTNLRLVERILEIQPGITILPAQHRPHRAGTGAPALARSHPPGPAIAGP